MVNQLTINKKLLWDYDLPDDASTNEPFCEWYVTRVLTHGVADDIRTIGLSTIHAYLPRIVLPKEIREFWYWYFNQPQVREQYGYIDTIPN